MRKLVNIICGYLFTCYYDKEDNMASFHTDVPSSSGKLDDHSKYPKK